jgi:hypothetical protein
MAGLTIGEDRELMARVTIQGRELEAPVNFESSENYITPELIQRYYWDNQAIPLYILMDIGEARVTTV